MAIAGTSTAVSLGRPAGLAALVLGFSGLFVNQCAAVVSGCS
jgi:hypothetical protein